MSGSKLLIAWRARADDLRRLAPEVAETFTRCADELEAALRQWGSETLNLTEAARASGYSPDHLARLVKDGKIPNAGTKHRPRIRRANLPRKATAVGGAAPLLVSEPRQEPRSTRRTG